MSVVAETLKTKIDYEANKWKTLDLPKAVITEIDLKVKLNVTAGTSVTANADAPYTVLKNINVVKGGKYPIQATGFLLYAKNYYEYRGKIKTDTLPSAGNTKDVVFELVIHPGYFPERKDDTSVVIDARDGMQIQVLWGSDSDLGSGYTINSGEIEVTVWKLRSVPRTIKEPAWEIPTKNIDQTYTDLGLEVELPEGKRIPKAVIVVRDSDGNRSDSVVTELGLVDKRGARTEIHRVSYLAQQYDDMRRYSVDPLTGVIIFDALEIGYINIIGTKDIVLGFTTAATGKLDILFPAHL